MILCYGEGPYYVWYCTNKAEEVIPFLKQLTV